MKLADMAAFCIPGRPGIAEDGSIVVAAQSPDLDADLYRSTLLRIGPQPGRGPTELTVGPRDSEPVISPNGRLVVFLRAPETGPSQLYAMRLDGGEPRKLTDHSLGAGPAVFSADGRRIAYCAPVPEPGRYGTDPSVKPEAEPPRVITRLSYRLDGEGFVADKPKQVFAAELDGSAAPLQLTDEPSGAADPAFAGDGRIAYVRSTGIDDLTDEIAIIDVPDDLHAGPSPRRGARLIATRGSAGLLTVAGNEIFYLGVAFTGIDVVGRTTGLWAAPLTGGEPRRLTDEDTVDVDRAAGRPLVIANPGGASEPGRVLFAVLDRGATSLRSAPADAAEHRLTDLAVVIGGDLVVRSFTVRDAAVAAVVADGGTAGEILTVSITADGSGRAQARRSDFGRPLVGTGIRPAAPLSAVSPDGYPVHGWLVTPEGAGPHPVLLMVHGGPHAAYTPALFDEAQVCAGAGYAVVLGNPRGSAGYGQQHGRSVIGALGTVDADDVLALLDAALIRPECDAGRVGVMGGSYGGFITSWLCSHAPDRFTAAISERAVNAWDSFAGSSDIGHYFARAYVGGDRDTQWRASPLAYAQEIDVPLLIIHAEHDWRCPVEQAQRLFVALRQRGADVEMLLFPGEGHELSRAGRPRHRRQRFEAILAWWNRYLPTSGAGLSEAGSSGARPPGAPRAH